MATGNGYKITKKMKVLALIAIPTFAAMTVLFLIAVMATKNTPFIIISMVLFIASAIFELYVIGHWFSAWFEQYKEKYKGL